MEEFVVEDVSNQGLKKIPKRICALSVLHELNASHNKLSSITTRCEFLRNIRRLDISSNKFVGMPGQIVFMTFLEHLDIRDNPFRRIPSWITELKLLQDLRLPIVDSSTLRHLRNDTDCRPLDGVRKAGMNIEEGASVVQRPLLTLPSLHHLVFTLERTDQAGKKLSHLFVYSTAEKIARAVETEEYNMTKYDDAPFFALPPCNKTSRP